MFALKVDPPWIDLVLDRRFKDERVLTGRELETWFTMGVIHVIMTTVGCDLAQSRPGEISLLSASSDAVVMAGERRQEGCSRRRASTRRGMEGDILFACSFPLNDNKVCEPRQRINVIVVFMMKTMRGLTIVVAIWWWYHFHNNGKGEVGEDGNDDDDDDDDD